MSRNAKQARVTEPKVQESPKTQPEVAPETESAAPEVTPEPETAPSKPQYNAVIVRKGANELRRYSREVHGSKYMKLAEEFAVSTGCTLEPTFVEPGILCPACGHKFNTAK